MAAHVVALAFFGALTLALTWPLATQLGSVVPHDLGDPLLSTWTLWWNAQVTPFTARWWDGLAFFPARNTLALSDHRVGLGLVATPLIWSGVSPLAAHNVAFLATFFLSASTAYALCFALTSSAPAAFLGGLIFGFNPFRAEHLPHLELLASYWLPVIFLALHRWVRTRSTAWLALLTVALTLQALTCGYYFFYAGVIVAFWLCWFLPRDAGLGDYARMAGALLLPLVLIAPVLVAYRAAHDAMSLGRSIVEIELLSADVSGLITAPEMLALWNPPRAWLRPEGAIFPGATAVCLVIAALIARPGRPLPTRTAERWRGLRSALLLAAVFMALVSLLPIALGPVEFSVLGLRISISAAFKPFTVATLLLATWVLTSARVGRAWREQSPFAFYALATIAAWVLAFGPTTRLFGERVLYKAPYAWLMLVPGFSDSFRAPARYAMVAALTLSVAAALAFTRLARLRSPRVQIIACAVAATAITAESWIDPLPLPPEPAPLEIPSVIPADAAIAELPFGVFEDAIAMYHSIAHGRRTLNGMSGYDPPQHAVLRGAMKDHAYEALTAVAHQRDIAVFVLHGPEEDEMGATLVSRTNARRVASTKTHDVYLLPRSDGPAFVPPSSAPIAIRALASPLNPADLGRMLDGDRVTAWVAGESQTGRETFTAELGELTEIAGVTLALGGHTSGFPRALAIEVSADAATWSEVWRGSTAATAVAATMADPRRAPLTCAFPPVGARFVRVTQTATSADPWAVAELAIVSPAPARPPL